MNEQDIRRLQSIAREPKNELSARIRALEEMARAGSKELVPALLELWRRPRSTTPYRPVNWDPDAAERVVDLYIILALCKSGDFSLIPQISVRVAEAGNFLQGPDSERQNAAKVIRAVGRLEPIEELVALAGGAVPKSVANAVRTLQCLDLPTPPSGGSVSAFPELAVPATFTIHRLKEELETIASLSHGRLVLSEGTKEWISPPDYERGEVRREHTSLAEILMQEIDMLDLTYVVTQRGVVIATFKEAGARWQQQWPSYAKDLVYDPGSQAWRNPPKPAARP